MEIVTTGIMVACGFLFGWGIGTAQRHREENEAKHAAASERAKNNAAELARQEEMRGVSAPAHEVWARGLKNALDVPQTRQDLAALTKRVEALEMRAKLERREKSS